MQIQSIKTRTEDVIAPLNLTQALKLLSSFQVDISDLDLARKILILEGKSSVNVGIINSLPPAYRGKGLAKRIYDSMELLASTGYGCTNQSRFYKNPLVTAEKLEHYGLSKEMYDRQYATLNKKSSHFLKSEQLRKDEIHYLESLLFPIKRPAAAKHSGDPQHDN